MVAFRQHERGGVGPRLETLRSRLSDAMAVLSKMREERERVWNIVACSVQFDHDGGSLGGADDVHTTLYVSRYVHSRSEVWAKAPEGFSARSTVGASKLRSQTEGACDACNGAHPPQKEKAPVAYDRVIGRRSVPRMDAIGCGDRVWMPLDAGIAYGYHWMWELRMGAIGHSNCVWLNTRDTWRTPSVHAKRDARRWCAERVMREQCPLTWAERAYRGRCMLTRGASTRERGPASLRVGTEWRPWG